jgi:hypothetical protein
VRCNDCMKRLSALLLVGLALGGAAPSDSATAASLRSFRVTVYFLIDGQIRPIRRRDGGPVCDRHWNIGLARDSRKVSCGNRVVGRTPIFFMTGTARLIVARDALLPSTGTRNEGTSSLTPATRERLCS